MPGDGYVARSTSTVLTFEYKVLEARAAEDDWRAAFLPSVAERFRRVSGAREQYRCIAGGRHLLIGEENAVVRFCNSENPTILRGF
jgi:hypothetical protein